MSVTSIPNRNAVHIPPPAGVNGTAAGIDADAAAKAAYRRWQIAEWERLQYFQFMQQRLALCYQIPPPPAPGQRNGLAPTEVLLVQPPYAAAQTQPQPPLPALPPLPPLPPLAALPTGVPAVVIANEPPLPPLPATERSVALPPPPPAVVVAAAATAVPVAPVPHSHVPVAIPARAAALPPFPLPLMPPPPPPPPPLTTPFLPLPRAAPASAPFFLHPPLHSASRPPPPPPQVKPQPKPTTSHINSLSSKPKPKPKPTTASAAPKSSYHAPAVVRPPAPAQPLPLQESRTFGGSSGALPTLPIPIASVPGVAAGAPFPASNRPAVPAQCREQWLHLLVASARDMASTWQRAVATKSHKFLAEEGGNLVLLLSCVVSVVERAVSLESSLAGATRDNSRLPDAVPAGGTARWTILAARTELYAQLTLCWERLLALSDNRASKVKAKPKPRALPAAGTTTAAAANHPLVSVTVPPPPPTQAIPVSFAAVATSLPPLPPLALSLPPLPPLPPLTPLLGLAPAAPATAAPVGTASTVTAVAMSDAKGAAQETKSPEESKECSSDDGSDDDDSSPPSPPLPRRPTLRPAVTADDDLRTNIQPIHMKPDYWASALAGAMATHRPLSTAKGYRMQPSTNPTVDSEFAYRPLLPDTVTNRLPALFSVDSHTALHGFDHWLPPWDPPKISDEKVPAASAGGGGGGVKRKSSNAAAASSSSVKRSRVKVSLSPSTTPPLATSDGSSPTDQMIDSITNARISDDAPAPALAPTPPPPPAPMPTPAPVSAPAAIVAATVAPVVSQRRVAGGIASLDYSGLTLQVTFGFICRALLTLHPDIERTGGQFPSIKPPAAVSSAATAAIATTAVPRPPIASAPPLTLTSLPSLSSAAIAASQPIDDSTDGNEYIPVPSRAALIEHCSFVLSALHGSKTARLEFSSKSQALTADRQYRVYYFTHVLMGASLWGVHPIGTRASDGMSADTYRVCSELAGGWVTELCAAAAVVPRHELLVAARPPTPLTARQSKNLEPLLELLISWLIVHQNGAIDVLALPWPLPPHSNSSSASASAAATVLDLMCCLMSSLVVDVRTLSDVWKRCHSGGRHEFHVYYHASFLVSLMAALLLSVTTTAPPPLTIATNIAKS